MSLVTTPRRASSPNAPHSAAIRLLLPEPTGPPTPIRSARSTGKESLSLFAVDGGRELDRDRGGRGRRAALARARARHQRQLRREVGEPAGGQGRIERQELQRRG